jgi:twitching motility protein PilT
MTQDSTETGSGSTELTGLLEQCIAMKASDLHLSAWSPPIVRLNGRLEPLADAPLSDAAVHRIATGLMHELQRAIFQEQHTLDVALSLPGGVRFRVNVFRERGHTALAIRRLDDRFRTLAELNLPLRLGELADLRDGLVLVTGPTGSGKSTTLATMIHQINSTRACHILTVEDPIEYVHANLRSLVHQRELHRDVPTFADAVRSALREDPDVILVGEMRDTETMRAAITAAETGHLVYSTLHTGDAVGALDRMIGMFPAGEQESIRAQLSMVLRAVVAQRLLPALNGAGRAPAVEVLRVTPAVANLIRTGKSQQIYSAIETGAALGMQTLEQSLAGLVSNERVAMDAARMLVRDARSFEGHLRLIRQAAPVPGGEAMPFGSRTPPARPEKE